MKYIILTLVSLFVLTAAGCQDAKKMISQRSGKDEEEPVIEEVQTIGLAKEILKSKPHNVSFIRDPFRPLLYKDVPKIPKRQEEEAPDLKLVGVVTVDKSYYALLESSSKTKVYKEKDAIGGYILEEINMNSVVLRKGKEKIVLKRGEQK